MRSPALTGASGTMRPPPCAAITSSAVPNVAGSPNAAMKQASDPSRTTRAAACQLATCAKKRRGEEKIAKPWRSRPVSPADVCATVYQCLGIDPDMAVYDRSGRPVPVAQGGQPVREILA